MIVYNVFSDDELKVIKDEMYSLKEEEYILTKQRWGKIFNKDEVYATEQGNITSNPVSAGVKKLIRNVLIKKVNSDVRFYDFAAYYQIWYKGAGCGLHKDPIYPFVATFYLNEQWGIDDGGLYIYEDNEEYKMIVPKYNSCNFNLKGSYGLHCVTPVTDFAHDKRYTIGVWGKG